MYERDTSFVPDLTPEMIDAAHRNARRERSKAFHDVFGAIGESFRGRPARRVEAAVTISQGATAKPC